MQSAIRTADDFGHTSPCRCITTIIRAIPGKRFSNQWDAGGI
ncbi:hypothetical protein QUF90_20390 [Desulfococcaceae bacterium HSG9]|nr:hypothetical protein [Desulfococcaceae bacterium HSG9]